MPPLPTKGINVVEEIDTYYRNNPTAVRDIPGSDKTEEWAVLGPARKARPHRTCSNCSSKLNNNMGHPRPPQAVKPTCGQPPLHWSDSHS